MTSDLNFMGFFKGIGVFACIFNWQTFNKRADYHQHYLVTKFDQAATELPVPSFPIRPKGVHIKTDISVTEYVNSEFFS